MSSLIAHTRESKPVPSEVSVEYFTIGWICALPEEYQVACRMLDEDDLEPQDMEVSVVNDNNTYVFGRLSEHYVVVGCLPWGTVGLAGAATVATDMSRSFPNLKFALMVGIGGGAPNLAKKRDIRLGDVVISIPEGQQPGVVQLDMGKVLSDGGFKRTGHLDASPTALRAVCQEVQRRQDDRRKPDRIAENIERMSDMPDYGQPLRDRLFRSDYLHKVGNEDHPNDYVGSEEDCSFCAEEGVVKRKERSKFRRVTTHYGTIASGNQVMKNVTMRDKYSSDDELNVLCFETEAAGLMNNLRCLVIRGICDYSDSHKNDEWHKYAALAAGAYAREVLSCLRPRKVVSMPSWVGQMERLENRLDDIHDEQRLHRNIATIESSKADEERSAAKLFRTQREKEETIRRISSLRDRLRVENQANTAIYNDSQQDKHPDTCHWLFARDEFKKWTDRDSNLSIFWLSGKHGAGKTLLCAAAVDYVSNSFTPNVIYQFMSNNNYQSRNQSLRGIANGLVNHLIALQPEQTPSSIEAMLGVNEDDSAKIERLIEVLIDELPLVYIFLDGLDEVADSINMASPSGRNRWESDFWTFAKFLLLKAKQNPSKLRLWCSSQPLPRVEKHLVDSKWSCALQRVSISTKDTWQDMMNYLKSAIQSIEQDPSKFAVRLLSKMLETEVEGSFLWASLMLRDLNERADTGDDLIQLALNVPSRLNTLYKEIMERILARDSKQHEPPLWRIVLSVLAFSRRPLRINEVIEAVAITWTRKGSNLSDLQLVKRGRVLDSCLSLVRYSEVEGTDNGLLRFSHSAVRQFLLEEGNYVARTIIRDCCFRYLCQPRYEQLLVKSHVGQSVIWRSDGESIHSHEFLLYAAKYWFLHYDSEPQLTGASDSDSYSETASRDNVAAVLAFLNSSQFLTCLQVQSLFIQGYFLQRFHPITDRGVLVRRTLPRWMTKLEPNIHLQYMTFQGEWCRLLQAGHDSQFCGEIDRCFWGALDSRNFLSCRRSRYQSFEFRSNENSRQDGDSCQIQHVSHDGKLLWTGWIKGQEGTCQLHVEEWILDGQGPPQLSVTTTIPFDDTKTAISLYGFHSPQNYRSFPLVPRIDTSVPPDAVSFRHHGPMIRIGSQLYVREPSEPDQAFKFSLVDKKRFGDSWEEVCSRSPFLVACRQRIYRERLHATREPAERQPQKSLLRDTSSPGRSHFEPPARENATEMNITKGSWEARSQVGYEDSDDVSNQSSDDSEFDIISIDSMEDSMSISQMSNSQHLSLAEESCSLGSGSTETVSSLDVGSQESIESESVGSGNDLDIKSQDSQDSGSAISSTHIIESNLLSGYPGDEIDRLSDSEDHFQLATEDGSVESDVSPSEIIGAEPAAMNSEPQYPVSITVSEKQKYCNHCNSRCRHLWYHCICCEGGNFNICRRCERKGVWCLELTHQLYKIMDGQPIGVFSRQNFNVRHEMVIRRSDASHHHSIIFHFRRKYQSMLHDSQPIIHPTHPLVVWAVCEFTLLFVDCENNKFFEQKFQPGDGIRVSQIQVSLSFSPCGSFLRMALVDAAAEPSIQTSGTTTTVENQSKKRLCLNLHVLLLQLSTTSPARTRPKLVASGSCRLGYSLTRPFVTALPFTFTWNDAYLYVSLSDSYLRLYRVNFQTPASQTDENTPIAVSMKNEKRRLEILVPSNTVLLPRSAIRRSVQFFPATAPSVLATVIIGPRCGPFPTPPIGVYLSEQDIGSWINPEMSADDESCVNSSSITLEGQFDAQMSEPFDEDEDCDLIPFDGY